MGRRSQGVAGTQKVSRTGGRGQAVRAAEDERRLTQNGHCFQHFVDINEGVNPGCHRKLMVGGYEEVRAISDATAQMWRTTYAEPARAD